LSVSLNPMLSAPCPMLKNFLPSAYDISMFLG